MKIADADLSAGRIDGGPQTQKVTGHIVMIAGRYNLERPLDTELVGCEVVGQRETMRRGG